MEGVGFVQSAVFRGTRGRRLVEAQRRDAGVSAEDGMDRRDFLRYLAGTAGGLWSSMYWPQEAAAEGTEAPEKPKMKTMPNGVRYVDFALGEGDSPKFGDVVWINYTTYGIKDGADLVMLDSSSYHKQPYMFKHGGGFTVQGLEEAVHTMKVGGRRRVVVPPVFGYVGPDLGPLPDWFLARKTMKDTLKLGKEVVVFDIELLRFMRDKEFDFGYYEDNDLTPDQVGQWWRGELQ